MQMRHLVSQVWLWSYQHALEHQYEQQREGEQIKTADGQPQWWWLWWWLMMLVMIMMMLMMMMKMMMIMMMVCGGYSYRGFSSSNILRICCHHHHQITHLLSFATLFCPLWKLFLPGQKVKLFISSIVILTLKVCYAFMQWQMVTFLLATLVCASSYVSSKNLGQRRQSDTGCICLTFLHCVFLNVSSNGLHEKWQSHIGCICLTFLQCAFSKCLLKLLAWEEA